MNCPWRGFTPGSTNFCEVRLCSWIESPGIAWAGLIYISVGLYLFFKQRDPQDSWLQNLFGPFAISMGVSSFLFHASHTFMFQAWDVGSMFLLGTALIFLNLKKLNYPMKAWPFWIAILIQMILFVTFKAKSGPIILGILILFFLILEFVIYRRGLRQSYHHLKITLGLFTVAVFALWMEHKSGLCDPDNHIFQWHAVWDGLCAFTYLTVHKHFRQDNT
jgi:hypothetical protein